jgi:hypothetical protein
MDWDGWLDAGCQEHPRGGSHVSVCLIVVELYAIYCGVDQQSAACVVARVAINNELLPKQLRSCQSMVLKEAVKLHHFLAKYLTYPGNDSP